VFCTVTSDDFRNVALNKRSYQVSTYTDRFGSHDASLANDGSRQTNFEVISNGCAASNPEINPWWAVDLGDPTMVARVDLTNRGDAYGITNWSVFASVCSASSYILTVFVCRSSYVLT